MNDEFEQRLEGVERLTKLFQTERMVYLIATIISLLMLVGSALSLMLKNQAAPVELSMLFGASGSIAYTTALPLS